MRLVMLFACCRLEEMFCTEVTVIDLVAWIALGRLEVFSPDNIQGFPLVLLRMPADFRNQEDAENRD